MGGMAAGMMGGTSNRSVMQQGQSLRQGESLKSASGRYSLEMQRDGNLVLYDARGRKPLWASGTNGRGRSGYRVDLQADQHFVLYDGSNNAIWASGVYNKPIRSPCTVTLQDDGNLVQYTRDRDPMWASNTHGGRQGSKTGEVVKRM